MNPIQEICRGFAAVYSGNNVALKHVCLLSITGIMSYFTVQMQLVSGQLKDVGSTAAMPNLGGIFLGLIVMVAVCCYLFGYGLKFMHNVYHENPEELLPEVDENPIKIFFKVFPLLAIWFIYFALLGIASAFLSIILIGLVGYIVILVMSIGLQFVWVDFAKDYDRSGLSNIKLPFRYVGPTILPLILLTILYVIVYFICMIPCAIVGAVMGFGGMDGTTTIYVGGILGGYIGAVCQLVWYYCIVKLYKEKFENGNIPEE